MSPSAVNNINSYNLTPDQHKAIVEESLEFEGQTPLKHVKGDVLRIHARNLELAKKSKNSKKDFVLPAAYSPCTASLNALQKISLSDLKLGTHHRGAFITARTITASYHSTSLITILEDDSGTVVKLVQAYQLPSSSTRISDSGIPINSTVAIKEPYCQNSGGDDYIIRVDHPSDIAVLRGDDEAVAMIVEFAAGGKEISAVRWKEAGDKAYLDGKFSSAVECYTQAIDCAALETQFKKSVLRKRAFANLTAKSFLAAKDDALASCLDTLDTADEKAYFCAGRASYELGLYAESKQYFERVLRLKPTDTKTKKELDRVRSRMIESGQGIYDFESMINSVNNGKILLDHADFLSNTVVRESPGKGRGLFATRDIERGEIVMVEKAICLPDLYTSDQDQGKDDLRMWNFNTNSKTQQPAQATLFIDLLKKVYEDPAAAKRVFDLDGGAYIRSGKEGEVVDGVPVVDSFLIEAIRLLNSFSCPPLSLSLLNPQTIYNSTTPLSTGLWTHAAYINHSCTPNAIRSFLGSIMIIRSTCPIPAGTEIVHQYRASDAAYLTRLNVFKENWGFECSCPLCSAESQSSSEKHKERSELFEKLKKEVMKSLKVSLARIKSVEKLTKKLEDLHERSVYDGIPKLLLIHPCIWLMERYREREEWEMVIKYAGDVLRNFGFGGEVVQDERLRLSYGRGIMNTEAMQALRAMSGGYRALGRSELAKECEEEAMGMFIVLAGSEIGVDEFFAGKR